MKAFNFTTMKPYTGANAELVSNGGELNAFATFNQINSQGFQVKKGAKAVKIFCGFREYTKDKDGNTLETPKQAGAYALVFDIADTTAADDKDFISWLKEEYTRLQLA